MADPFLGEIKIVSFNFAPKGWAQCNGQFLPINQNQALFSLFGTTYGGNGQTTFALPDFRSRTAAHMGGGLSQGERIGQEAHTITLSEMPAHNHVAMGSNSVGNQVNPNFGGVGNILASDPGNCYTSNFAALGTFSPAEVSNVGGSQPHTNLMPFLVLNFIVALQGIFPSRN
ncbi:phage tail protein [Brevifollis gellanilyticus]|uniref:Tail Collar domain-containing protein n=1 Tax=Brevifollis gellanilyticus TaxID=748831 RepID=A0A512M7F8_9BACT|nr:tail fiber protein [Brevifollis gellanilyticus]GEP42653.1 tail Collar domain-containing protein [Brevifollis gellanilyticus]